MVRAVTAAVQWFLDKHGLRSADQGMCSLARQAIRPFIHDELPFDMHKIAKPRMISDISSEPLGRRQHAVLIPKKGGFHVKLNQLLPKVRQRFGLAHEIGHTFFFNVDSETPFRPYHHLGRDPIEERLCNIFAAEVLMPGERLVADVASLGSCTADKFLSLARIYGVSNQYAAIRITGLRVWNMAVIAWAPSSFRTPKGEIKPEEMRVQWSAAPRGCFIPKGDSLDEEESIIQTCYESGLACSGLETFSLGSVRGKYKVECIRATGVEGPYVLSLIHL